MRRREIHQIVSGFVEGDAISNNALCLRGIFQSWGHDSEIFCPMRHISPKMRGKARPLGEHKARSSAGNVVIFHFSIGSETVEYFKSLPDARVLVYHNITPGHYYRGVDDERETLLNRGRDELKSLSPVPALALADSGFNAAELKGAGYRNVRVLPIIIDLRRLDAAPDRGVMKKYGDGIKNILFVGRVVPNKRFEDVIKAFHAYRLLFKERARLLLVGSYIGLERYLAFLKNIVRELKLDNVVFTGHVTDQELAACYRVSSLFLCMSEHEGFCIPILEAMRSGIPVIAYDAGAVPETLGESGVLVKGKDYLRIAEMMELLLKDDDLRNRVIERQHRRLKSFNPRQLEEKLKECLSPWLQPF